MNQQEFTGRIQVLRHRAEQMVAILHEIEKEVTGMEPMFYALMTKAGEDPEPDEKPKRERKKPLTVELPFTEEAFVKVWKDFILHRSQLRKPLTPVAQSRLLDKC